MDGFRNKLVMESNQVFVDGERLVLQPILRVAKKLRDALHDFRGITSDIQFIRPIFARPFPNMLEHFAVQRADVGRLERIGRCQGSSANRSYSMVVMYCSMVIAASGVVQRVHLAPLAALVRHPVKFACPQLRCAAAPIPVHTRSAST
jgi:hypothetical protein